jgi:hypothetical protein
MSMDGIYLQGAQATRGRNLNFPNSQGWCLWNTNNGYLSCFENIITFTGGNTGQSGGIISNFGPNVFRNHFHTGGGVAMGGWGMKLDTAFYNSSCSLMLLEAGIDATDGHAFTFYNMSIGDEGGPNNFASAYLGSIRGTFTECTFEKALTNVSPLSFSGASNAVIFTHCTFNAKAGTSAIMIQNGASAPYNVIVNSANRWPSGGDPSVPLAIDPNLNVILNTV